MRALLEFLQLSGFGSGFVLMKLNFVVRQVGRSLHTRVNGCCFLIVVSCNLHSDMFNDMCRSKAAG